MKKLFIILLFPLSVFGIDTLPLDTFITVLDYRDRQLFCEVDTTNNWFQFLGWETSTSGQHECSLKITLPDVMTKDNWSDSTWPDLDSMPQVNDTVDYFVLADDSANTDWVLLYYRKPPLGDSIRTFTVSHVNLKKEKQDSVVATYGTRPDSLEFGYAWYHTSRWGDIDWVDSTVNYTTGKFLYLGRVIAIDSLLDSTYINDLTFSAAQVTIKIDTSITNNATYPLKIQLVFNKLKYGSLRYIMAGGDGAAQQDPHMLYTYHGADNNRVLSYHAYLYTNPDSQCIDMGILAKGTIASGPTADSVIENVLEDSVMVSDSSIFTINSSSNPVIYNDSIYYMGVGDGVCLGCVKEGFNIFYDQTVSPVHDTTSLFTECVETLNSSFREERVYSFWFTSYESHKKIRKVYLRKVKL